MTTAAAHTCSSDTPVVSVVVPVYNMRPQLRRLIHALERQTIAPEAFEVVIVDDGSTDDSVAELPRLGGRAVIVRTKHGNAYAARNVAVRRARAAVIASCDADCEPEPEWLERGLAALERADLAGGLIRFDLSPDRSLWSLIDVDTFLDQERAVRLGNALGGNVFFRKSIFDLVGGFDETQPNQGDYDFAARCVAAGARLVFARDVVAWHPARSNAQSLLRKIWAVNRRYAERELAAHRRPEGLKLRNWVPVVQTFRSRRRFGRSLGLDRRRMAENQLTPRLDEQVLAIPLIYLVVPYLGVLAQLRAAMRPARVRVGAARTSR